MAYKICKQKTVLSLPDKYIPFWRDVLNFTVQAGRVNEYLKIFSDSNN